MKKPFLVFLDAGHGGIIDGKYVTPGKRSPSFSDGCVLYEGVYNREIVSKLEDKLSKYAKLSKQDVRFVTVSDLYEDTPLWKRVKKANDTWEEMGRPDSIYISVHANAFGTNWNKASGFEVFTSKGQTKSDIFSSILIDTLKDWIPNVKWRTDNSDGDEDKEANFQVLRDTLMPAILSENGFMTNREEAGRMMNSGFREDVAQAHFVAIMKYRKIFI